MTLGAPGAGFQLEVTSPLAPYKTATAGLGTKFSAVADIGIFIKVRLVYECNFILRIGSSSVRFPGF